ncbi:MAG: tRNA (N6-isopentenyl adenosine(37)-C2)-methylthiotransferase MiaB [Ruminococcaceae bacterium]|nr:tRNA (N6-isopentenyl adenosine(37)-C2)-methylthiotransferase MiaB [Oscillospiraceae bacterium]
MKEYKILPDAEMQKQREYIEKIRIYNERITAGNGKTRYAYVQTFGCQQNEADSERLAGMCEAMGYVVCDDPKMADIIIVNTCAIREHAEQKALSIIGQYKHLKAEKPDMLIGVCGCMVTQEHRKESIKHSYPYVDFVFGTSSIYRLPELVFKKLKVGKRLYCSEETEYLVAEGMPVHRESNYRAWVSIMYGCNNFCTYCIVPYVRGRERSRRPEDIIAEVRELVELGYKDITLLGQNVNSYGKDVKSDNGETYDFADLLSDIDKIEGDYYIRFMTSHPKDASKKLIDVMAESRHVAHQFHLPLQSGSDRVLKAMNRHYDKAKYLDTVEYLRKKISDVTISSDIIVGFPGETEEDFLDTISMLKTVKFDMTYSFIYSPRKDTPAAAMQEQISDDVKGERMNRLLETQNAIALEKNKPMENTIIKVLCDGPSKNNKNVYSGRSEGNKIVLFQGDENDIGKFINLKIVKADTFALHGEKA